MRSFTDVFEVRSVRVFRQEHCAGSGIRDLRRGQAFEPMEELCLVCLGLSYTSLSDGVEENVVERGFGFARNNDPLHDAR